MSDSTKAGLRVLVCGGRDYGQVPRGIPKFTPAYYAAERQATRERAALFDALDAIDDVAVIIEGGATGADRLAAMWARGSGVELQTFRVNWSDLSHPDADIRKLPGGKLYDAAAGPRRNQRMIDEGKPDLVVAATGGRGTADMLSRARAAGIPVNEVGGEP